MWCNHKNVACGDHLASDLVLEEVFLVAFLTTVKDNLPVFLGKCSNRASRQQGGRRRRQTIAVATTPSESNLLAEARSVAFTGGYSAGTLRVRRHHRPIQGGTSAGCYSTLVSIPTFMAGSRKSRSIEHWHSTQSRIKDARRLVIACPGQHWFQDSRWGMQHVLSR